MERLQPMSGGGANYTVSATGMSGSGVVQVSMAAAAANDLAGNGSLASTSTDNTVSFDNVAPSVTINQASGQIDPTNASPILFTVVFSEPVTGFTQSDVSISGSAGGPLAASVSGGGASYTVSVTGMSSPGTVVASIPAATVTDLAGNPNGASTSTSDNRIYTGRCLRHHGRIVHGDAGESGLGHGRCRHGRDVQRRRHRRDAVSAAGS